MSPIVSLRSLTEPAYLLLGGILHDDEGPEVRVLRSPASVVAFDPAAGPTLRYFATLRGESEAVEAMGRFGGDGDDLYAMVAANTLVRLPADGTDDVRRVLGPLCVRVTAPATVASDGRTVLLKVGGDRAVAIGPVAAAVLNQPSVMSLEDAVAVVARDGGLDPEAVWRSTIHDLTGVFLTGAGHLAQVGPS